MYYPIDMVCMEMRHKECIYCCSIRKLVINDLINPIHEIY